MAKNGEFYILTAQNGIITFGIGGKFEKDLDVRKMPKNEKFELIRWAILDLGMVFTEKIERMVRKEIDFPHD